MVSATLQSPLPHCGSEMGKRGLIPGDYLYWVSVGDPQMLRECFLCGWALGNRPVLSCLDYILWGSWMTVVTSRIDVSNDKDFTKGWEKFHRLLEEKMWLQAS